MAGATRLTKRRPTGWATLNSSATPSMWLNASDTTTLAVDGAASFTAASSQYLSVVTNATLQVGDVDFGVGCWFYVEGAGTATRDLVTKSIVGGEFEYRLFLSSLGVIFFLVSPDGTGASSVGVSSGVTVSSGQWYFVLAYHDSVSNVLGISVNGGTFVTTPYASGVYVGGQSVRIGGLVYLNGRMDSTVLLKPPTGWLANNASALKDYLYNGGLGRRSSDFKASTYYIGGNPSGAVSWWDLDERPPNGSTLTTRNDRIGTNHLTDNNFVGYAVSTVCGGAVQYDGDPVTSWTDKNKTGKVAASTNASTRPTYKTNVVGLKAGVQLDGVDDFLTTSSYTKGPNYTIVAVVKNTDATTGDKVISEASGIQKLKLGNTTCFQNFSNSVPELGLVAPSTQSSYPTTITNINIVSVVVGTTAAVYTNGQRAVSVPVTGTGVSNSVATTIGASGAADFFKGTILEYIEYGVALTDEQRITLEKTLAFDYRVIPYPAATSNTTNYLNYYRGDPGLGLNENWNVSFGSYPLNVIQGFVSL